MAKLASRSGSEGLAMILTTRFSPRPLRTDSLGVEEGHNITGSANDVMLGEKTITTQTQGKHVLTTLA